MYHIKFKWWLKLPLKKAKRQPGKQNAHETAHMNQNKRIYQNADRGNVVKSAT